MICDGLTKYFFLNFEIKIIKCSSINQQKGHNFVYLQEGIVFVSLIISTISFSRSDERVRFEDFWLHKFYITG